MHQDHNLLPAISPASLPLDLKQNIKTNYHPENIPKPMASEPFMILSLLHVSMNILQTKENFHLTMDAS